MSTSPTTLDLENLPDGNYVATFNADSVLYDGTASQTGVTSTCSFTMGAGTPLVFTQTDHIAPIDSTSIDLAPFVNADGVGAVTEKTDNIYTSISGLTVTVDVDSMIDDGVGSSSVVLQAGGTELQLEFSATISSGGVLRFTSSAFHVSPGENGIFTVSSSTTGIGGEDIRETSGNPYLLSINDQDIEIDVAQMKADQERSTDLTLEVNGTTAIVSVGIFLNIADLPVQAHPGTSPSLDANGFVLAISGSVKKFRNKNGSQIYRCIITDGQVDFHLHPEEE